MGWGGSAKTPPPPDYKAQAEATAASAAQAQTQTDWANRPTINTPFGSQSWQTQSVIDPTTGKPVNQWTMNQTFDPRVQGTLDAQMTQAQQNMSQPFDWDSMQAYGNVNQQDISADPYMTSGAGEGIMRGLDPNLFGDAGRQRYENALLERMRPEHERAQSSLDTKLANMGATVGGRGWGAMQQNLGDERSRQKFNALEMGGQEQQRQFNMALGGGQFQNQAQQQAWQQQMGQNAQNYGLMSGANAQNFGQQMDLANYQNQLRDQQTAEQMMRRQMPLTEMDAMMKSVSGAQFKTPDFNRSAGTGGVDYTGAAQNQYNAQTDAYNAQQANKQSKQAAVAGIASVALMAF